jgi:hypothetical protein
MLPRNSCVGDVKLGGAMSVRYWPGADIRHIHFNMVAHRAALHKKGHYDEIVVKKLVKCERH